MTSAGRRRTSVAIALVVGYVVVGRLLPNGLPFGVVVLGLVLGGLSSLTAFGLVLVYRSARIINFAQAEIGGLAATVAVLLVAANGVPYLVAVVAGLVVAVATGAVTDAMVIGRVFRAPRLIVTVATIGVAQVLGAAELGLPQLLSDLKPLTSYTSPISVTFTIGPLVFGGDHVLAMVVLPVVLVGLGWFFNRSDVGIAIRGAADSDERALLLGIPVRRLSRVTWMVAAGLSGLAATLTTPILGANLGVAAGPRTLLAPLAAAVLARMESLPVALGASLAIGVFQQAAFWSYPRSSAVDVGLFFVIMVGLLVQRRRRGRIDDAGLGSYVAQSEIRPIPRVLRDLREVRIARAGGLALLVVTAVVGPLVASNSTITLLSYMAIHAIIGVSLVVLTGWAGQISLGQFALVGVGAATTASLIVHRGLDLFAALVLAGMVAALVAVLVGIPALRIPGLFLAVATLAFAVPVSSYLLNSLYFPTLNPQSVDRPLVLDRFPLDAPRAFYFLCLGTLCLSLVLAHNFRRSRIGRAVLAVRDNERGAASFSISPMRAKLIAFAFSGALAGVAGGLYVVGLRRVGFGGFDPGESLVVFTMVVVGGLGSLPGAVLGAVYVRGAQYFLDGPARLLATGAGMLLVIMLLPGGLGDVVYRVRDALLRWLAQARGLSVPSLAEEPAFEPLSSGEEVGTVGRPLLRASGLDVSYGSVQVLFGAEFEVADGEVIALLGTNGAGKSTLLRALAGILEPSRGSIAFDDVDITGTAPVDRVRAGLVMAPGGRGVFPSLTVAENLRLAGWLSRRDPDALADARARVATLFPALDDRMTSLAGSLSGGEQQMLVLAQALLCKPKLLLVDELSLGLAPTVVAQLLDAVRSLVAEGVTVVLVEQSVNVATAIAQRAVFMERGHVRFCGPVSDLLDRPDLLRSVFLGAPADRAPVPARPDHTIGTSRAFAVDGIGKQFGGVVALAGVDLEVAEGEIVGIIGANGAGKTTLFDICSGFLRADVGSVQLGNLDVTNVAADARAARGLGRVFQDARLFPSLTVAEALAVALERHVEVREPVACALRLGALADSEAAVWEAVDELIASFGLDRYRDAFVSELSTGTRRMVELACSVAHRPDVLLLDEPSSGIAQRETEALAEVLLRLRAETGATFVVIEHDVPLVSSIADRLICLDRGRVIAEGEPVAVLADPAVIHAYLGSDPSAIVRSGRATTGRRRQLTKAGA